MNKVYPAYVNSESAYNNELHSELSNALLSEDIELAKTLSSSQELRSVERCEEYLLKGAGDREYSPVSCGYKLDLLVLGAKLGDEPLVRHLLSLPNKEVGANMNTALWFACRENNVAIAELLLARGASPDYALFSTPCIHVSAVHAAAPLLSSLLAQRPALALLPMRGSVRLEVLPDRPPVTFPDGALPVHMSAFGRLSSLALLELLLPRALGVDAGDARGRSALIYASKGGNLFCLRALLRKRADIEHRSAGGKSSLLYAARDGRHSVLELLIRSGASPDARDAKNRGVFSHARDEEVASRILACFADLRGESPASRLPVRELAAQGYHRTLQELTDTMVSSPRDDTVRVDLGQLESVPSDREGQESLLALLCDMDPSLPIFESLALRSYADYHMARYGYAYLAVMTLELLLYLLALSLALILGVRAVDADRVSSPSERFRLAAEVYVAARWGLHGLFELLELGIIFRNKYVQLSGENFSLTTLHPSRNVLVLATLHALREYTTDLYNSIDVLVLLSALGYVILRVSSLFVSTAGSTSVFSVLVYFFSTCLVFRYVILIPGLGSYLQTLIEALKDSVLFMLVFCIPLFAFSGMFLLAYLAPPFSPTPANATGRYDAVRVRFDEDYVWLLLTGVRLLIEQGAIIKFNYLEEYNWLMVLVFMGFAFLTLLVMRTLFVGRISSEYKRINRIARRYATYRTLRFLIRLQTKSIYSLSILKLYIQKYEKQVYLTKEKVRYKHPGEFQRLFSTKGRGRDRVCELDRKLDLFRSEVLDRIQSQENKLDQIILLLQRTNEQT